MASTLTDELKSHSLTISAIVCTRNRSEWAAQAVRSLLVQDIAPERLEIVVVDNDSSDNTAEVIGDLVAEHPNARYVHESKTGLSNARNRAIAESTGAIVAFLDDDAEAVPGWASAHVHVYERDDNVVGTGGRIILGWPSERPAWLPASWDGMYAGLDRGSRGHVFESPRIPYGANMAIRRQALAGDPAFHTALGRQGEDLTSGEERDLFERLRDSGSLVYVPRAEVTHHVLPDRLGRKWFFRRAYAQGRSEVLIDWYVRQKRSRRYWIGRLVYQGARTVLDGSRGIAQVAVRRPPTASTESLAEACKAAGKSRESARVLWHRRPNGSE